MNRIVILLLATAPLAACGLREPLQPPPGESMPPPAAMARRAPTTEELLTPPPIARPERVDELLRRSEERRDDRFDLPPPDVPAGEVPAPGNGDEEPE
jgi:predicted small lipoprotein YifL